MSQPDGICIRQPPYAAVPLHPPADHPAAPASGKTGRPGPGQGGVKTAPQPARAEPKVLVARPASAEDAARRAEAATSEVEDARINLANAKPYEIEGARTWLAIAQKTADEAVKKNVEAQTALHAQNTRNLQIAVDAESAGPRAPSSRLDAERQKFNQEQNRISAENASKESRRSVAVALGLQDIAKGVRPGRNELAKDTTLEAAQLADDNLAQAHAEFSKPNQSGGEKTKHLEDVQNAASVNRAEWAALSNKAASGDVKDPIDKDKIARRLQMAERELAIVSSPEFRRAQGL